MRENSELEAIPGIGREYARLLESADISTRERLCINLSTDNDRQVVSWKTGISEKLLLKWYQLSFEDYDPADDPTGIGVSIEEASMLEESVLEDARPRRSGLIAPDGALPLHTTDGKRVQDGPIYKLNRRIAQLRIFTVSTLAVVLILVGVLLFSYLTGGSANEGTSIEPTLEAVANAEARARFAHGLFQESRFKEAEVEYRQALLLEPENITARTGLGRTLIRLNRLDNAAEQLRRSTSIDPTSFEAHYFLSTVLIQKTELVEALEAARNALRLVPNHPWAAYNLGLIYHLSNKRFRLEDTERTLAIETLIQELSATDRNPDQSERAIGVLRSLTDEKFGFDPESTPEDQETASQRWIQWWREENKPD